MDWKDAGGFVVVLSAVGFLLRMLIEGALKRTIEDQLNKQKADLQKQVDLHKAQLDSNNVREVERLKAELSLTNSQQLERLKAELGQQNDSLRNLMQVELVRLQSAHTKKHQIYPELFRLLKVAEGTTARLRGGRIAPNLDRMSVAELKRYMAEKQVPQLVLQEIDGLINTNKPAAILRLEKELSRMEPAIARRQYTDANNYLVINLLYIKKETAQAAFRVIEELHATVVDVEMEDGSNGSQVGEVQKHIDAANAALDAVEEAMRRELST